MVCTLNISNFVIILVSVDPCGNSKITARNAYIVSPGWPLDVSAPGAADCSVPGSGVTGRQARQSGQTYTWTIAKADSAVSGCKLI